jgi:capsular polysaccharide biosynthesis protein
LDFSKLDKVITIQEQVCFIGGAPNYTHWLTDIMPSALLCKDFSPQTPCLFVGLNDTQRECLNFLNVKNYKMLEFPMHPYRLHLKKAILFTRPSHSQIRGLIAKYSDHNMLADETFPKKIYFYKSIGNKRVKDEHLLLKKAYELGVKVIDVCNTSFLETIKFASNATHIYTPYGGSIGNVYFSKNAIITILVNQNIINSTRPELLDSFTPLTSYSDAKMVLGKQVQLFKYPLAALAKFPIDNIFST